MVLSGLTVFYSLGTIVVLLQTFISKMLFISPLPEMPSGQRMAFPHIFLTELGEQPDLQREGTAGQMEVREIVGWDRDHQIM